MPDKLKPVPCGCGGEAQVIFPFMHTDVYLIECNECGICTSSYETEAEAIEAWNTAMSGNCEKCNNHERTAKVIEYDASVTDTDGYKYHRSEYLCGACKKRVIGGDEYCSRCGAKLDWSGNE